MKKLYLVFILSVLALVNYGQVDSLFDARETSSTIVYKARKLMLEKFSDGDLAKVREIKDYMVSNIDSGFISLYPYEYVFLMYLLNDFQQLAEDLKNYETNTIFKTRNKIRPIPDTLFKKVYKKTIKNKDEIKNNLAKSDLDDESKQVLEMNLDAYLMYRDSNIYAQDLINDRADSFLKKYPSSNFEYYTKNIIWRKFEPVERAMEAEFFSGSGVYTGELSKSYTNCVPIGVAFGFYYKNMGFYIRDYIGFNQTKKDFEKSYMTLKEGAKTIVMFPELSIGYTLIDCSFFKLSPNIGIGAMDISPAKNGVDDDADLAAFSLEFTTTYVLGFNLDIKFGSTKAPAYSPKTSYGFLRIRYSYNAPQYFKKYDGMNGEMHSVTIGLGYFNRNLKRVKYE